VSSERGNNTFLVKTRGKNILETVSINETHQAKGWMTETNAMSVVCDTDIVDGVETPAISKEESSARIVNINHAERGKDDTTVGGETDMKQAGVKDAKGDTGEHNSSSDVGDYSAEVNGICVEENTSNIGARNRSTSETLTAENTEVGHIVDFLDKNNQKVYFSLSHPLI
jgi:hypothetical protein